MPDGGPVYGRSRSACHRLARPRPQPGHQAQDDPHPAAARGPRSAGERSSRAGLATGSGQTCTPRGDPGIGGRPRACPKGVSTRDPANATRRAVTAGGWQDWEWDETLFAGAAPYYMQGRLPYAEGLGDALRTSLALDGRGRLLDVGCGPGVVTVRLAHLFDEVVGL